MVPPEDLLLSGGLPKLLCLTYEAVNKPSFTDPALREGKRGRGGECLAKTALLTPRTRQSDLVLPSFDLGRWRAIQLRMTGLSLELKNKFHQRQTASKITLQNHKFLDRSGFHTRFQTIPSFSPRGYGRRRTELSMKIVPQLRVRGSHGGFCEDGAAISTCLTISTPTRQSRGGLGGTRDQVTNGTNHHRTTQPPTEITMVHFSEPPATPTRDRKASWGLVWQLGNAHKLKPPLA